MEKFFKMAERGSSTGQEVRAGLTTFLAMAYIIAVNPTLLSAAGIPTSAAVTATCIGAGIMTILMGVFSNRPLACASGMGVNAVVAFTLTALADGDWHVAMAVIFLEGIVILILVICGLREAIMDAIPASLRHAIAAGLGLFIALIGLINGQIVVNSDSTLITMGSITNPSYIVAAIAILTTFVLYCLHVKGEILWGILVAVVAGIPLGVTTLPTGIVSGLDFSTFAAPFQSDANGIMGIAKVVTTPALLLFVFSLMMSDFFDTMGTAFAVAKQGDFLTEDGKVEDIKPILIVDSCAAAVGGFLGASSITTFVESTAGAADGGRTGLTSITTGVLFFVAAFFSPLIAIVSSPATTGALVMVGFLMMGEVTEIDWHDPLKGIPAFMIVAGVPLTYSISTGIGLGFITYVVVALACKKSSAVKPLMWVAAFAFLISFFVA
jgi:AGZA family xanthine/uracil permease-like MFS transporter